jgi:hypothetical protein
VIGVAVPANSPAPVLAADPFDEALPVTAHRELRHAIEQSLVQMEPA